VSFRFRKYYVGVDSLKLPVRKSQRLKNFDYSQNNAYFITICTQDKVKLFGEINNGSVLLNDAGIMVSEKIADISKQNGISVDKYVVMPNHIHALITISHDGTAQGPFPRI